MPTKKKLPKTWSAKRKRQYQHIKESEKKRGGAKRAKRIAAATVNKQRSKKKPSC